MMRIMNPLAVATHGRFFLFAIVAVLLLAGGRLTDERLHAQDVPTASGWIAWLFEQFTGTVTQIRDDGSLAAEISLPLSPAFNEFGLNAVVSPSGTHIAYIGADTLTGGIPNRQLFIYDLALRSVVATYSLPPEAEANTLDYVLNPLLFDEAARRIAFGYVLPGPGRWEIVVIDYGFADVVATLTSDDPGAQVVENDLVVPAVQRYQDGVVTFSTVFYATEAGPDFPTFAWAVDTGTVSPSDAYTTTINDTLSQTGEVVSPGFDDRFEVVPPLEGGLPQLNVLTVYTPSTGERFPFYHDAGRTLLGVNFVQNGARVVTTAYDPADGSTNWTVVDRGGTPLRTFLAPESVARVFGTAQGFVYVSGGDAPTLNQVITADDSFESRILWQGAPGRFLSLIFMQSLAPPQTEFPAWARLAGPQPIDG